MSGLTARKRFTQKIVNVFCLEKRHVAPYGWELKRDQITEFFEWSKKCHGDSRSVLPVQNFGIIPGNQYLSFRLPCDDGNFTAPDGSKYSIINLSTDGPGLWIVDEPMFFKHHSHSLNATEFFFSVYENEEFHHRFADPFEGVPTP